MIQKGKSEPQYDEFEEVTMNCYKQNEALKYDHNSKQNEIYYCILSKELIYIFSGC